MVNRLLKSNRKALLLITSKFPVNKVVNRSFSTIFQDPLSIKKSQSINTNVEEFQERHVGPNNPEIVLMLESMGHTKLTELLSEIIPKDILLPQQLRSLNNLDFNGMSEVELLERAKKLANENKQFRSFIGMGYVNTHMPTVIQRNILENPGWYTQYTPYQAEISQGRLESLFNFQTMVSDLTQLPFSNSSLLDEGTAAAEAMVVAFNACKNKNKSIFIIDSACHPQTIEVVKTRAEVMNIKIEVENITQYKMMENVFGVLFQYPNTYGEIYDFKNLVNDAHQVGAKAICATDLLALTKIKPPGEFGCDIALGTTQRFGVPIGFGGPHAAFFAVKEELKRLIPGRIVGLSKDKDGNFAYRLALQTREQHIKREKALSNICTSQALLANIAAMYSVYHGPKGLSKIANKIHNQTKSLKSILQYLGYRVRNRVYFDTLTVECDSRKIIARSLNMGFNLRYIDENNVSFTLDETVTKKEIECLVDIFNTNETDASIDSILAQFNSQDEIPIELKRETSFLQDKIFNSHHTETQMLRYIFNLQKKDLSLTDSMIPLGSCTMKLNSTTEMMPISWPEFNSIHPFAPISQASGFVKLIEELEVDLAKITGFDKVTIQPNSGAMGEYTGLRVIKKFHESKGNSNRNLCFIPVSAHGTNPASAAMAGMKIISIECDKQTGNLSIEDLEKKLKIYGKDLAAIMITYPSTFGVFESTVKQVTKMVHQAGGLVYMDGANMNAQIGITHPSYLGADVCHLNLHKTFCIPHGGGGPGVGPIGVKDFLVPFLPRHPFLSNKSQGTNMGPVASAPFGSAGILPVSWSYIKMMGLKGLRKATSMALLNANYICNKLKDEYTILYTNEHGRCAHEFIIDLREFKDSANIEVVDVAKRLIDFGFHSPTMSWPIPGTLMIEPTESESKAELDRFIEAMTIIRKEIREIEEGKMTKTDNPLKNAPHSSQSLLVDEWNKAYSRNKAAFPVEALRFNKFWPSVSRVDDVFGDRNLVTKR